MLSQKYVIRLLPRLIFAIEWHHCASNIFLCASNIFLLLIKRLLLGDSLEKITDNMDPFCSDMNLVLSNHNTQVKIYIYFQFLLYKSMPPIAVQSFKLKSQLFANIIRSCRSVVARGRNFVAISSHHCRTPSHHSGASQLTRTFDAPYPHILSHTILITIFRITSAYLTHQIRIFRCTVSAHFVAPYRITVAKRGSVTKRSFVAKCDTLCKTRGFVGKRGSVAKRG